MSLDNLRVLSTGNPTKPGLAKELSKEFPNADFLSLSTGVDLVSEKGQEYFKSIVANYDVFVNISHLPNNTQEKLLKIAHQAGMKGHVFNIGSIAEYKKWEWYNSEYTAEKRQLRETSLELCSQHFKTTHIVVGGFQDYEDNSPERMDPIEIVNAIKYIINAPIHIPLIGVEKILDEDVHGKLRTA